MISLTHRTARTVGIAGLLIVTLVCKRNVPPDRPYDPQGPPFWRTDTLALYTSRAEDQDDDSVAIRFSWGDGDTSDWSKFVPAGRSISLGHTWSTPDTYLIRAQAKDSRDGLSDWSYSLEVVVGQQSPPEVPRWLDGPSEGVPRKLHVFTVVTVDPEKDSIRYEFDWGDGDTSLSPWCRSGDSTVAGHAWAQNGTYSLRVRAWDVWGSCSDWSDSYQFVASAAPGDLMWRYVIGYEGDDCSPAISVDGTVYVVAPTDDEQAFLFALNPDSTLRWKARVGNWVPTAPAIGPDGTIYVVAETLDDGLFAALRPDGSRKRTYLVANCGSSSPAIGPDGTVYVGSYDRGLYAINPDGSLKWRYETSTRTWFSSPSVGVDGTVYVGSDEGYLLAVYPDGKLKWQTRVGFYCELSSPAIGPDGTIYIGADSLIGVGLICAVNPDGTRKWTYLTEGEIQSSPALAADGTVYIGCEDGCLYAVNPDGTLKWKYVTDDAIVSSPAIGSDGTVYFGNDYGYVIALTPEGRLMWEYNTGDAWIGSSPAISPDGTLYIACMEEYTYLLAIKCTGTLANTSWPKFRHDNRNSGCATGR